MNNNKNLMESILTHLRKLIILTENGDEDQIQKLVNSACEVSNQLIRIEKGECIGEEYEESEYSEEDSGEYYEENSEESSEEESDDEGNK
jgi:hypothetical protein